MARATAMAEMLRSCTGCTSKNPKLNQAKPFGLYRGGGGKNGSSLKVRRYSILLT
jgi:hypothetical protein